MIDKKKRIFSDLYEKIKSAPKPDKPLSYDEIKERIKRRRIKASE